MSVRYDMYMLFNFNLNIYMFFKSIITYICYLIQSRNSHTRGGTAPDPPVSWNPLCNVNQFDHWRLVYTCLNASQLHGTILVCPEQTFVQSLRALRFVRSNRALHVVGLPKQHGSVLIQTRVWNPTTRAAQQGKLSKLIFMCIFFERAWWTSNEWSGWEIGIRTP